MRFGSRGRQPRSVSLAVASLECFADSLPIGDKITILSSYSETYKFPAAVDDLDTGKVKLDGIVSKVYKIEQ
ncbi:Alcohol dehydrogenase superfamily, zinc-type [Penicillium roqueforti FM164]|uniref:Alcohol dehydrogenase superfamily, zinc-type n=1 Tax=Penicillium roqueforti (strain FM164) TaxID=1365484 RepID=W6PQR5_PENRF|nr:Alcohol dehydrogenase superfamily, zinc-type [Penicillium roqueforti FM164]